MITSLDNSKIAQLKKLADKKYRKQFGLYVVEGERLVKDAIKHGAKILSVFVKQSQQAKYNFQNQLVVADNVFNKVCDTVSSQGVIAVVEQQQHQLCCPTGNALVLDCLQDPGNVGTLIRTAAACGFSDVYAINSVDVYSPKVVRSAMSAHFCVRLHVLDSFEQVLEHLGGVPLVVADMDGQNVFQTQFAPKSALLVGNEGNGVSPEAKSHATQVVSLPMQNNFESLNVSVAGSVIMYQMFATSQHN